LKLFSYVFAGKLIFSLVELDNYNLNYFETIAAEYFSTE